MFGFGYIVTATFLVAIVRQGDAGRQFEALVWLATGLAGIPSVWLWNRLAARAGLTAAFALGCLVEAVGVTASVALGGFAGPLLGGFLLGGTFIAITALGLQIGRLLAPEAPRRVLALMTASFGLGQILGPIAAGWVAEWTGNFVAASIGAAVALLFAGAIAWSAGPSPKSP
jgi:predicted MFS family arabinose efflux permease